MLTRPRKMIGLLLAVVLAALLLVACGDNTPTTASTTAAAPAAATAATATTAAATATTASVATTAAAVAATTAATATTAASGTTTTAAVGAATTVAGTTTTAAAATGAPTTIACTAPIAAASNGKTYRIGISVQNTIPALFQAIEGVKEGLAQCGFTEGKNVRYDLQNAQGDIPSLSAIGRKFSDDKVDLIVAIGTAALTNMYTTNKDSGIPIVFNSVTDPYVALPAVIKSATEKGPMTGIQALPPVEDGLSLIKQSLPNAKKVGFILNKAEANAVATLKEANAVASKFDFTIVEKAITNSNEVRTAALSLVNDDKVDVFFVTTDVTVVNALDALVTVAIDNKKPMVGLDPTSAPKGVPISVGLDYRSNGVTSAKLISQILDGKKVEQVAIERQPKGPLAVNLKGAEEMGFKIPESIINQATVKLNEIKK